MTARAPSSPWLLALLLSGCVIEPVDLADRGCPCIDGWRCDVARDRCVPEGEPLSDGGAPDAAVRDAGIDAGRDAGLPDADVPLDAPPDAPIDDASMLDDAEPIDAGADCDAEPDAGCEPV